MSIPIGKGLLEAERTDPDILKRWEVERRNRRGRQGNNWHCLLISVKASGTCFVGCEWLSKEHDNWQPSTGAVTRPFTCAPSPLCYLVLMAFVSVQPALLLPHGHEAEGEAGRPQPRGGRGALCHQETVAGGVEGVDQDRGRHSNPAQLPAWDPKGFSQELGRIGVILLIQDNLLTRLTCIKIPR